MPQSKDDLSRSLVAFDQNSTVIALVELSSATWLVGGIIPGINRDPLKKLVPDQAALLKLVYRWRDEARNAGQEINRIAVAFEAGRDGFWLARWLRARGIEAHVNPPRPAASRSRASICGVAKTDRLDIALLKRAFLGWLQGEKQHCTMAAVPTLEEEDAKRPHREREQLVGKRTGLVNRMKAALVRLGIRGFNPKPAQCTAPGSRRCARRKGTPIPPNTLAELQRGKWRITVLSTSRSSRSRMSRLKQLKQAPGRPVPTPRFLQLEQVRVSARIETADMLRESKCSSATSRDQRALGRYGGAYRAPPTESGQRRREKVSRKPAMHAYVAA